jgi:hypothetical protein
MLFDSCIVQGRVAVCAVPCAQSARITRDFAQKFARLLLPGGFRTRFGFGNPQRPAQPAAFTQELRNPFDLPGEACKEADREGDDQRDAEGTRDARECELDFDSSRIHRGYEQRQQSRYQQNEDEKETGHGDWRFEIRDSAEKRATQLRIINSNVSLDSLGPDLESRIPNP